MNAPTNTDGSPLEIVVAEDSATQAQRLRHILTQQGYHVTVTPNGRLALDAVLKLKPALVISDVVMPEMDGYELCSSIKSNPAVSHIPVILVTTMSDPEDVIRGLECRADNFILKPYDERYLLGRLQFVLVNQEMRQTEQPGMGLEIFFNGQRHFITADRLQILNLLLSTYDAAIQRNKELSTTQSELREANAQLQGLTLELEDRVARRTEELAHTNESLQQEISVRREAEQKLHAQLAKLALLSRITRAIGERQDLRSIYQVVIRSLEDNLPIDFGCLCLYDDVKSSLTVSCVGVRSETLAMDLALAEHSNIPADTNGLAKCVQGHLVHEPDISQLPHPFARRLAKGGLRSLVATPLLVEGHVSGVLIAARTAAHSFSSGECEFLRQLGEHVALATNQAQLHGALQQAYDDLRRSQQAVMQQERLRALGQMASGIAHDINNALSPAALYAEALLEREPGLSERARKYLKTIQQAVEDVAQTVTRMREFYRQREPELPTQPVAMNNLIQQVLDLTRVRWNDIPQQRGAMIQLRTEFEDNLPVILGVENEIRDALTNLILNAVDAMPGDGTLTARTRSIQETDASGQEAGPRSIYVEVSDTGIGMDEDTTRRCLEPFFTTKGERGTGLGLAMVYGMVQRHDARIEIESTPGKGTLMRLIFPVLEETLKAPVAPVITEPTVPMRLLIIDDDPLLIKSLKDTLEGEGHFIHSADGGTAGIDAFREALARGEPYDAVITDLGMPYVDGRKVAANIKAASPNTHVIMLTGWGERIVSEGDIPPHVDQVLSKPPKLREVKVALATAAKSLSR
jgi:signal transduction histidine kinase/DNA-binding response OmpR family regulator